MSGFFGASFIEQVRSASDIIEVIGGYFPLKRSGANFVALCPFHREKSPSFSVSPGRQAFYCFGCHKGGDVFRFLQEYESITFVEAVQRLAQRASIPVVYEGGSSPDRNLPLKETLRTIHEQIAKRWQTALAGEAQGQIARDYLARRGVSEESIQLFRIGYAPDAWDDTVNWCKAHSFDLEVALQAGLILKNEEKDRYYDRFRGRLMFPICDEQGRVIAFSGRVLTGDEKTAKYVNSPETPLFTKGKVFYGLDKTKRAILEAGHAIICEGQLDLIACFQAGVRNVVAPQGTAFTQDHARILKRYVEEVVLCFDSDNAGQNAAARVLESLLGESLAIRVATIPSPHDPDSFLRENGAEAFRRLIQEAVGFFDFYLQRLCTLHDPTTDKGRLAILREMGTAVHKTGNSVMLDKYTQKTAVRLGVSAEAVRLEFRKLKPGPTTSRESSEPEILHAESAALESSISKPDPQEAWLLKLLLTQDDVVPVACEHLKWEWVRHGLVRAILERRLSPNEYGEYPSAASVIGSLPDDASRRLATENAMESRSLPNVQKTLMDILTKLRNASIDREMSSLVPRLDDASLSPEDRLQLVHQLNELRSQKKRVLE